MRVLLTGAAGFIGYHVAKRLVSNGHQVLGLDNLNDYYDVNLKLNRLKDIRLLNEKQVNGLASFDFIEGDITNPDLWKRLKFEHFDVIIHLAAQAGVRYTIENPGLYVETNVLGFLNLLEYAKSSLIRKVVYASSSSVYGNSTSTPFAEETISDVQLNIYGLSKRVNEMMADTYAYLNDISFIGLRFFTVYGPFGRPDMAMYNFVESIRKGVKIKLYNHGRQTRDFTHVDDIVDGIIASVDRLYNLPVRSSEVFNLGYGRPVNLLNIVSLMESFLKRKAVIEMSEILSIEMTDTYCSTEKSRNVLGFSPSVSIEEGMERYIDWHTSYYY